MHILRRAVPTLLTVLLVGAAGCTADDEPPTGEAELTAALATLSNDPDAARDFLTGGAPSGTTDAIEAADVPSDGRVTWLVTGRAQLPDEAIADLGTTLVAATSDGVVDADARAQARAILDEAMGAAEDDGLDPRLRPDLAQVAAANASTLLDEVGPVAARQADWEQDPRRAFLVAVGQDEDGRRMLHDALVAAAQSRLEKTPEARLETVTEQVGLPLARLLGAVDSSGDADAFADDQQALVRMFTVWARQNTDDEELATNLANDVGAAFQEQFG